MNKTRTVIHLEETIGKQVGRRKPPADPRELNKLATGLLAASGHKLPRRGVFRFHRHEEADQWMMTNRPKPRS